MHNDSEQTSSLAEGTKVAFFKDLDRLGQSSDSEDDSNELRTLVRDKQIRIPSSSLSKTRGSVTKKRATKIQNTAKTVPHQTAYASPSISETPEPFRKTSLLRYDISIEATPDVLSRDKGLGINQSIASRPITEHRSVSTPTIGSVTMTHSLGITNMLKKRPPKEPSKRAKRKAEPLEMKPESERIFQDKVFYYIPDNDIHPLRKIRIRRARSYGATWIKEWDTTITHIIVDLNVTYEEVTKWLREQKKVPKIPENVVLVNDTYPLDCIQWKRMVNPNQIQYQLTGAAPLLGSSMPKGSSQELQNSLKIKGKPRKRQFDVPETPSPVEFAAPASPRLDGYAGDSEKVLNRSPHGISPAGTAPFLGDALDEIINTVKTMPHLDDDDEDQSSPPESGEDDGSGSEGERAKAVSRNRKRQKTGSGTFNQSSFSCMRGGTGQTLESNPNKRTIELLQELADYYERIKDTWRFYSYRKAIGTLKRQTVKISTYEEAIALETIGKRLAKKIEEIVRTDRLQRLENALLDPSDKLLQMFMKVYGAGISQAEKWIKAGYKSLDDLIENDALTPNQRIGVDHYHNFNSRIPRDEVTALGQIVKDMAATIDPSVEIIIGGSYRRGAPTSGDIDCLITKPGTSSSTDLLRFLHTLVANLTDSSFLVAALAVPGSRGDTGSKWHGACVLPKTSYPSSPQIWRRIDLLLVPATEFGAALIYFTGNDIFNRSLRLLASRKQMRLNQRGLYKDVMRGPGRVKLSEGTLVEGADEKRIFEILGVPWREPEHRIP